MSLHGDSWSHYILYTMLPGFVHNICMHAPATCQRDRLLINCGAQHQLERGFCQPERARTRESEQAVGPVLRLIKFQMRMKYIEMNCNQHSAVGGGCRVDTTTLAIIWVSSSPFHNFGRTVDLKDNKGVEGGCCQWQREGSCWFDIYLCQKYLINEELNRNSFLYLY